MGTKLKVSIKKCGIYDAGLISEIIEQSISDIGFDKKILTSAKKILLKPNLLAPHDPESAITTHPVFIEGVILFLKKNCGKNTRITIADSPGATIPHVKEELKKTYDVCGMARLGRINNVFLSLDESSTGISFKEGLVFKHIEVIDPIIKADLIINLPKFKTHSLTGITGAVKNMFGIIPGRNKALLHTKFLDVEKFCDMNLDIFMYSKPVLNIMDAITGIEGEGPGASGSARKIGFVLTSEHGVAMDNVVASIMGFAEGSVPVIECAARRGIPGAQMEEIELTGSLEEKLDIKEYIISDYIKPKKSLVHSISKNTLLGRYLLPFVRNTLSVSPYQDTGKCTMCMECIKVCPEEAIRIDKINDSKLIFDYKKCIRCYCCSEMCPAGAISLQYSIIGNLIFGRKNIK
jgi:uncharacterized protein (DUF362 family)/Pyruvate/2-oxoacid:ferredoxin oxidoreductase delta subunit